MNLLDSILNAQDGGAVQQLGSQFGLGTADTTSALGALVPAIAAGLQRNTHTGGGLTDLLTALQNGGHQQYIEDPATLGHASTVQDGNAILGHVFGSKDVSRQVAAQAAADTGVSTDILKQMLPLAAALAMGAMSRQSKGAGSTGLGSGAGTDLIGMLAQTIGGQSGPQAGGLGGLLGKLFR
jgi:hypothetical protein